MSISNTYKSHIIKLTKKIDSKLFDLLVDLDDQNANGYDHTKTNYELMKIIFQKIILDKKMNIHPYPKGVYEYKSGVKHEYTSYELTIGKDKENMIQLVNLLCFSKQKPKPWSKNYEAKDIVKKYKIDLVNLFRTQSYYFSCKTSHVDTISINSEYVRFNNKLSNIKIPIKCGMKLPDQQLNTDMNNFAQLMHINYKKLIQEDNINKLNNIIINDKNNLNNSINSEKINPYNDIKNYEFKPMLVDNDISFDDVDDDDKYKTQENIEEEIKFYETKLGIVSNTHKNKDRFKYLQKLAKKFENKKIYDEKFANYYNYTKSINFSDL